jgi:hypothetical protein
VKGVRLVKVAPPCGIERTVGFFVSLTNRLSYQTHVRRG